MDERIQWDYNQQLLTMFDDIECYEMYGRAYNLNFVPTLMANAKVISNNIINDLINDNLK